MKDGDYIVGINEEDVKWSKHEQVVTLIKSAGNSLKLQLVTPLDKHQQSKDSKVKHWSSILVTTDDR